MASSQRLFRRAADVEASGLESLADLVNDPLLNRTFGGQMAGEGFVGDAAGGLKSAEPVNAVRLGDCRALGANRIGRPIGSARWPRLPQGRRRRGGPTHRRLVERVLEPELDFRRRAAMRRAFARVTQAYMLQRWITACGGRGNYPIKFNGSIFTVEPKFSRRTGFQRRLAPVGRLLSGGRTRDCPIFR